MLSDLKMAGRFSVRLLAALCLAVLSLVAIPGRAEAHAQYAHSLPAANARLASSSPPERVQVWFTERIEPSFSRLTVYNQSKQRVDADDSHVAPDDPYSLVISLRPSLPDAAYTVVFQNVSLDDGHHVVGAFSFVVGGSPLPTGTSALPGLTQSSDENLNGWSITIRWLNYLGQAAFVGGLAFLLLVWRPTVTQLTTELGSELSEARRQVNISTLRFLLWSLLALMGGWVAMLLYQTSAATEKTLWQLFADQTLFHYATESHFGIIWLIRLGLIVLAFPIWYYGQSRKYDRDLSLAAWPWLLLLLGIAILVTNSLNSHAAANQNAWVLIPLDVLHLVSAGFWIGGLFSLIIIIPSAASVLVPGTGDRTRFFARLIPHFSRVAIVCVIILGITGIGAAVAQLRSFDVLLTSTYGRALDVKILLFLLLLCLGAYNLLRISPRMNAFTKSRDKDEGAGSLAAGKLQMAFRSTIRMEALLMVFLFIVVGCLTSLSPPLPNNPPPAGGPYIRQGQSANVNYRLVINPGKIGENTIEVALTDISGKPIQGADAVLVRFTMLDMAMGVQEAHLQPVANQPGYYTAVGSDLSMAGLWQITLVIRRTGFDDVQISFSSTFH
jgi:copper transport protein